MKKTSLKLYKVMALPTLLNVNVTLIMKKKFVHKSQCDMTTQLTEVLTT